MPKLKDLPDKIRPYIFHGLDLDVKDKEATGDCVFCGAENKFSVRVDNGLYKCWSCEGDSEGRGSGNVLSFLRAFWDMCFEDTGSYKDLVEDRGLLYPDTPVFWGVAKSKTNGQWLVPGFNAKGDLFQLYRYATTSKGKRLLATPTLDHAIHGVSPNVIDPKSNVVYVTEGPWDGMALWEVLRETVETEDGLQPKTRNNDNMLVLSNVISVPGCNVWPKPIGTSLGGKQVVFLYDNDHPRTNSSNGKQIDPAGISGVRKACIRLNELRNKPEDVLFLGWGKDGSNTELDNGMDIRDYLGNGELPLRIKRLEQLVDWFKYAPSKWFDPKSTGVGGGLECLECRSYKELTMSWRKALKWTIGLDVALSVMLASIVSTRSVGVQLWIKVIGPASCGKSTLCEAVSINNNFVYPKSTIRGFHSGFGDGDEDHSLISKVSGKTLVTKDGDTLLQSPNLPQILSEGRDLYDTVSRSSYRNKSSRDYTGIRMTWLLCGTGSLKSIDNSELGERFLDCVIMERIEDDLEDEILLRATEQEGASIAIRATSEPTSQQEPELTTAMQLTGGYIDYLCSNSFELLSKVELTREAKLLCSKYGKFVSYMRARPSKLQDETAERELAARLARQHVRLAMCLAVVMNRSRVDVRVMKRVRKVAIDTAKGVTLDIVSRLYELGSKGSEVRSLAHSINRSDSDTRKMLRFLNRIEVVEIFRTKSKGKGRISSAKWRLREKLSRLYEDVYLRGDLSTV